MNYRRSTLLDPLVRYAKFDASDFLGTQIGVDCTDHTENVADGRLSTIPENTGVLLDALDCSVNEVPVVGEDEIAVFDRVLPNYVVVGSSTEFIDSEYVFRFVLRIEGLP
jgi:hypothetical protein